MLPTAPPCSQLDFVIFFKSSLYRSVGLMVISLYWNQIQVTLEVFSQGDVQSLVGTLKDIHNPKVTPVFLWISGESSPQSEAMKVLEQAFP